MSKPIVSIIIPVYNAETTIRRCVQSILNNGYPNMELILINDGSKDRSGEVCEQLAKEDARVKFVDKPNGGVSSARNKGLSLASGKYVMFLDADDMVSADMYEKMVSRAEERNADCVICNQVNIYASERREARHVFGEQTVEGREAIFTKILEPLITPGHPDARLLQSPCNKLYRNERIREQGLLFSALPYAEDWLFNIEYLKNTDSVSFLDDMLYFYDCTTEGSLSKKWREDSFRNTVWIQNRLAELFPGRYSQEFLNHGVLGIQEECLRNYAYYRGAEGFYRYTQRLISDPLLREAYLNTVSLPAQYSFAKKCVLNGWSLRYCLWGMYTVKANIVKHYLRILLKR